MGFCPGGRASGSERGGYGMFPLTPPLPPGEREIIEIFSE